MTSLRRFAAPVAALLAASLLAACGIQTTPSATPPAPTVIPVPSLDVAGRDAYSIAICPVFDTLLALDPRLAAMREAGAAGGDVSVHAEEIDSLSDELLALLNELEALPEWTSGADLRFQLITALHGMRAHLLAVSRDPGGASAADTLAAVPFIASDAMDLAMQDAVQGGLICGAGS